MDLFRLVAVSWLVVACAHAQVDVFRDVFVLDCNNVAHWAPNTAMEMHIDASYIADSLLPTMTDILEARESTATANPMDFFSTTEDTTTQSIWSAFFSIPALPIDACVSRNNLDMTCAMTMEVPTWGDPYALMMAMASCPNSESTFMSVTCEGIGCNLLGETLGAACATDSDCDGEQICSPTLSTLSAGAFPEVANLWSALVGSVTLSDDSLPARTCGVASGAFPVTVSDDGLLVDRESNVLVPVDAWDGVLSNGALVWNTENMWAPYPTASIIAPFELAQWALPAVGDPSWTAFESASALVNGWTEWTAMSEPTEESSYEDVIARLFSNMIGGVTWETVPATGGRMLSVEVDVGSGRQLKHKFKMNVPKPRNLEMTPMSMQDINNAIVALSETIAFTNFFTAAPAMEPMAAPDFAVLSAYVVGAFTGFASTDPAVEEVTASQTLTSYMESMSLWFTEQFGQSETPTHEVPTMLTTPAVTNALMDVSNFFGLGNAFYGVDDPNAVMALMMGAASGAAASNFMTALPLIDPVAVVTWFPQETWSTSVAQRTTRAADFVATASTSETGSNSYGAIADIFNPESATAMAMALQEINLQAWNEWMTNAEQPIPSVLLGSAIAGMMGASLSAGEAPTPFAPGAGFAGDEAWRAMMVNAAAWQEAYSLWTLGTLEAAHGDELLVASSTTGEDEGDVIDRLIDNPDVVRALANILSGAQAGDNQGLINLELLGASMPGLTLMSLLLGTIGATIIGVNAPALLPNHDQRMLVEWQTTNSFMATENIHAMSLWANAVMSGDPSMSSLLEPTDDAFEMFPQIAAFTESVLGQMNDADTPTATAPTVPLRCDPAAPTCPAGTTCRSDWTTAYIESMQAGAQLASDAADPFMIVTDTVPGASMLTGMATLQQDLATLADTINTAPLGPYTTDESYCLGNAENIADSTWNWATCEGCTPTAEDPTGLLGRATFNVFSTPVPASIPAQASAPTDSGNNVDTGAQTTDTSTDTITSTSTSTSTSDDTSDSTSTQDVHEPTKKADEEHWYSEEWNGVAGWAWLLIALVAFTVFIVIISVSVWLCRRRRRNAQPEEGPALPEADPDASSDEEEEPTDEDSAPVATPDDMVATPHA